MQTATHPVLPECAAGFATITGVLDRLVKDQAKITETIFGNSKPGLKDTVEDNSRLIGEYGAAVKEDRANIKKKEEERKSDSRKWWLGVFLALFTSILSAIQTLILYRVVGK